MVSKDDFNTRLNELSILEDGWLDGSAYSITQKSVDYSKCFIEKISNNEFEYPLAFPEYNGGIILEWFNSNIGITLEVESNLEKITLSAYDFINKKDFYCDSDIENTNVLSNTLITFLDIFRKKD
jgi:hypothetical protein